MEESKYFFKILLLGDAKVGKSALLLKFTEQKFSESYISTLGVSFVVKEIELEDRSINLQIWDTSGQERFKAITSICFKGAHGIILMYNCSDRASFENLPQYINQIRNHSLDEQKILVVESQTDENCRAVTLDEGYSFASSINSQFISVNNRTGFNVEHTFIMITRSLIDLQNTTPLEKEPIDSEPQQKLNTQPINNEVIREIYSKILIIGDLGVGKSCLLIKYIDDIFLSDYPSTIGIDFKVKQLLRNGVRHNLQIWDTAGQERFKTIATAYYKGCHGVIVLFNIEDASSYENVQVWIEEVKKYADSDVKIIIAGNDFNNSNRAVSFDQASEYASSINSVYIEVNVKTGSNVNELFERLAEFIYPSTLKNNDLGDKLISLD